MTITLDKVLNHDTVKVIEILEKCSIEEISKKLLAVFQSSESEQNQKELFPLEKYPVFLGASEVQEILHVCEAVAYQVMHCEECPTMYMGKRMVVQREAFWQFLQEHKGKRLW